MITSAVAREIKTHLAALARERDPLLAEIDVVTPDIERLSAQLKAVVGIAASLELSRELSGANRVLSDLKEKLLAVDRKASDLIREIGAGAYCRRESADDYEARERLSRDLWASYHGIAAAHHWYSRRSGRR